MPPTSTTRGLVSPLNARRAYRNEIRSLCFQPLRKLRLRYPLYKFFDGFPPTSFLKTFRTEGS
jgi:hypothetical protein